MTEMDNSVARYLCHRLWWYKYDGRDAPTLIPQYKVILPEICQLVVSYLSTRS